MYSTKRFRLIDTAIFMYFNSFLLFLLYQLHNFNYKYSAINNFYFNKAIILIAIIIILNGFIYLQFDNPTVFRISIITEFYVAYLLALITVNSNYVVYIAMGTLLLALLYRNKGIYMMHLSAFLGVILGNISYLAFSMYSNKIDNVSRTYIMHLLLSLVLSVIITILNAILTKTPKDTTADAIKTSNEKEIPNNEEAQEQPINISEEYIKLEEQPQLKSKDNSTANNTFYTNEDEYLKVTSITAVEAKYSPQLNVLTETVNELVIGTEQINTIIEDLKKDLSIVTSDSKSVKNLSATLKKDIHAISAVSDKINEITMQAKTNLVTTSELFESLLRTSLKVSSTHTNMTSNLSNIHENTDLLNDILVELENLSIVTSHLANKTNIEANKGANSDVMNTIITEFHNYAEEIRSKIINMSSIFDKLNTNYYTCKQELSTSDNLIAANGLIISKLYSSLDTINLKFNEILNSTSSLEGLITTANVKAKNLVADSYELNNALHQFGKVSYAISRLNKK